MFWNTVRRWRTYIVNFGAGALIVLPEILNAPELLAVVPASYHKWIFLGALFLNVAMRPRPAVLPDDPEVDMRLDRIGKRKRNA